MAALSYTVKDRGNAKVVYLSGSLAEATDANLRDLFAISNMNVIFDFDKVELLNTVGIREWVMFINEYSAHKNVSLENCSSNIIMLINMLPDFAGRAEINSLYRTYFCDHCSKSYEIPVKAGENLPTVADIKSNPEIDNFIPCSSCGGGVQLEAEVPTEDFYAFINKLPNR